MLTFVSSLARQAIEAARAFGSAGRVAAAVEAGRSPDPGDLDRLGIGAASFAAIRLG